jgi:hypothetical protein
MVAIPSSFAIDDFAPLFHVMSALYILYSGAIGVGKRCDEVWATCARIFMDERHADWLVG